MPDSTATKKKGTKYVYGLYTVRGRDQRGEGHVVNAVIRFHKKRPNEDESEQHWFENNFSYSVNENLYRLSGLKKKHPDANITDYKRIRNLKTVPKSFIDFSKL